MESLDKITQHVCNLVKETGTYIKREAAFGSRSREVTSKGLNNFVTTVDTNAEGRLVNGLKQILPAAGFITEENTINILDKPFKWIIDPLDGTTNFIHGIPVFSISVALMEEDEVIIGVVYEVTREECFYAWKGHDAAYLNGHTIRTSNTRILPDSLIATGFPYDDFSRINQYLSLFKQLMQHSRGLRRLGSAAVDLAYVACGRFDAFFEYSLEPWDVAAGALIVRQAGGQVSDFKGEGNYVFGSEIVAGNTPVFRELLNHVKVHFQQLPHLK